MIEIVKKMVEDRLNEVHTTLPAIIREINHGKGICTVEIIPKRALCGQLIKYPPLIDVRLDFLKFGNWKLQFPRKIGDSVWVAFSETTLDENTSLERFSLNEPYIIGSCENGYEDNSEDIILTNNATRIEIKGNGDVVLTTGSNEMTINSNITVNGNINQTGEYTQTGNYNIAGNVAVAGTVEVSGNVTGQGISLKGHTHTYNPGDNPPTNTSSAK